MRLTVGSLLNGGVLLLLLGVISLRPGRGQAQEEVYHPGETYDSLQAGYDAYLDSEAERRAQIGRQIMLEEQVMVNNTWANPAVRYRPVHPESYGPVRPQFYTDATLADVYGGAPPPGRRRVVEGYRGVTAAVGTIYGGSAFTPWPLVPGDIYGTPYYGYVRQPIGHIKIWTGPQSYIYKPIYASPPMAQPVSAQPRPDLVQPANPRAAIAAPPRAEPAHPAAAPAIPPPPQPGEAAAAGPQAL